jgi:hypothetical protein
MPRQGLCCRQQSDGMLDALVLAPANHKRQTFRKPAQLHARNRALGKPPA